LHHWTVGKYEYFLWEKSEFSSANSASFCNRRETSLRIHTYLFWVRKRWIIVRANKISQSRSQLADKSWNNSPLSITHYGYLPTFNETVSKKILKHVNVNILPHFGLKIFPKGKISPYLLAPDFLAKFCNIHTYTITKVNKIVPTQVGSYVVVYIQS
jgi:hypothetical protein